MDISKLLNNYFSVIDKLISISELTDNPQKIKSDLLDAAYLNFTANAGEDPAIKPMIETEAVNPIQTPEEFEVKMKEFQTKMQDPGFDFVGIFKKSMKQTLEDLVIELEVKLSPEKILELKKIISEEI